jgi:hypothetical protein
MAQTDRARRALDTVAQRASVNSPVTLRCKTTIQRRSHAVLKQSGSISVCGLSGAVVAAINDVMIKPLEGVI